MPELLLQAELGNWELVLEWSGQHLQVLLQEADTKVILAAEGFTGTLMGATAWHDVLAHSRLMGLRQLPVCFLCTHYRAVLIPGQLERGVAAAQEQIVLLHGHEADQSIQFTGIPSIEAGLYWQLPQAVYDWVVRHFMVVQWKHAAAGWVNWVVKQPGQTGMVIVYPGRYWLVLGGQGQLLHCWPAPYTSGKDVAWLALQACALNQVEASAVQWHLFGLFSTKSALYNDLGQFLENLNCATQNSYLPDSGLHDYELIQIKTGQA